MTKALKDKDKSEIQGFFPFDEFRVRMTIISINPL
jgi:hypothetical protein